MPADADVIITMPIADGGGNASVGTDDVMRALVALLRNGAGITVEIMRAREVGPVWNAPRARCSLRLLHGVVPHAE